MSKPLWERENIFKEHVVRNYQYLHKILYGEYGYENFPHIYNAPKEYKDIMIEPFKRLVNTPVDRLHFIEFSGGDYYFGGVNAQGQLHGLGIYIWKIKKVSFSSVETFEAGWYNNGEDNDTVYFNRDDGDVDLYVKHKPSGVILHARHSIPYHSKRSSSSGKSFWSKLFGG